MSNIARRALARLARVKQHLSGFNTTKTKLAAGALTAFTIHQYMKNNGIGFKKDINREHVYITGAGSGIGKIIAKKLAKLGARITVTDIDLSSAEQTGAYNLLRFYLSIIKNILTLL